MSKREIENLPYKNYDDWEEAGVSDANIIFSQRITVRWLYDIVASQQKVNERLIDELLTQYEENAFAVKYVRCIDCGKGLVSSDPLFVDDTEEK